METQNWNNRTEFCSPGREHLSDTPHRVVVLQFNPETHRFDVVREEYEFTVLDYGSTLHFQGDMEPSIFHGIFLVSNRCLTEDLAKVAEKSMVEFLEQLSE